MTCSLVLIRHGATAWNRQGRYQGHSDPPLDRQGRSQARRVGRALTGLRVDAVYSSDLRRAVATAAPLAQAHGLSVITDPRLRELHFGAWDGRLAAEVIAADPAAWEAWWGDPIGLAPPGGETVTALWARVGEALAEIATLHRGQTAAVVTHGGPLRAVIALLSSGELTPLPAAGIPNGGWVLATPAITARLIGFSDTK